MKIPTTIEQRLNFYKNMDLRTLGEGGGGGGGLLLDECSKNTENKYINMNSIPTPTIPLFLIISAMNIEMTIPYFYETGCISNSFL